jgi:hypothetical protein
MSLYAIPQVACRFALGVTMLVTSERTVEILAEAVRRAFSKCCSSTEENKSTATRTEKKPVTDTAKSALSYIDLTTAYAKKEWKSLGISGLMNVAVGAAALFAANRFSPALFASATSFARNVVGI